MKKLYMNINDVDYALKNSEDIEVSENDEVVCEFEVIEEGLKKEGKMVIENGKNRIKK